LKGSDKVFIALVGAIGVYWAAIIIYPDLTSPFVVLYYWLLDVSLMMGYPGLFIISFLGNATILVPFPYIGAPFILGGLQDSVSHEFLFNPTFIGLVGGAAATLGEMTGYVIGYLGGRYVESGQRDSFLKFVQLHPKLTPAAVWFLAVTPLPDDILVVPLGAARYPWWKVIIPQLIGKTMFLTVIAWAGRAGLEWVETFLTSGGPTSLVSKSTEVLTVLSVLAVVYLIIRMDWSRLIAPKPREDTPIAAGDR
jgi:membrane protein YqaA with SNARE-associated domain